MARPKKCRKVCAMPQNTAFVPKQPFMGYGQVTMTVDEYETIRLIDLLDLTQEECAQKMQIARTTVQAIYVSARKKIGDCIVHGKQLVIDGGDVVICGGTDNKCIHKSCGKSLEFGANE